MLWRRVTVVALAVLGLSLATAAARAGDTVRLGLNTAAPTMTLAGDTNADTLSAWYRGGYGSGYRGFYGSGYRGFYGGGYRSFYGGYGYRSFYGGYGYRGFYPSYYRSSFYYGGYYPRVYAYSSYYQPYSYYSSYYQPYSYYSPPIYYSAPAYYAPSYCPIGYAGQSVPGQSSGYSATVPQGPMPPADGTYPYDGGPQSPVPMPKVEPAPSSSTPAKPTAPAEGRAVSLPAKSSKYVYLGYGEQPERTPAPVDRTILVKTPPK
jgi:hypothetical protein